MEKEKTLRVSLGIVFPNTINAGVPTTGLNRNPNCLIPTQIQIKMPIPSSSVRTMNAVQFGPFPLEVNAFT